jgi:hypothetical protein
MKFLALVATLMMGSIGLSLAQGTGQGAAGGLAAPGIGSNPDAPSGAIPGANNSTLGIPPSGATNPRPGNTNPGSADTNPGSDLEMPGEPRSYDPGQF